MQNYYHHIKITGKRLLLVFLFMTLSRFVFYILNYSFFASLNLWQVLQHFAYGVRFDLATIFLFNLPFIFLSILPDTITKFKVYQGIIKGLFIVVNSVLFGLNFIDAKFYEFEGKRLTADIMNKEWLGNDFITLLPEFIKDFWYLFVLFIAFIYLFTRLYGKTQIILNVDSTKTRFKYLKQGTLVVLFLGLSVIGIRGGVQLKPIGVIAAARYTSPQNMALILNSPFTIVKTYGDKPLPNQSYFNINEIDNIYSPVQTFKHKKAFAPKNVIIIILESFGKEYSGYLNGTVGYMPHLDSIMKMSLTFENAFANGKRSIEALPSIFSSIPALMDKAFVNTQFTANSIEGFGDILGKKGYVSSFFHGGKNGTMGFDNFVKLVGITNYYGLNEYPNALDYDGNWGVFDEPYLQYFAEQISKMPEPFFTSVFTLSSHHPYKIPEKYEGKFRKGKLPNLESIAYADYALGEFFKTASQQAWFKNTLFVLTADHTAQSKSDYYRSNAGKYKVPLVFYAPGDPSIRGLESKICQQADILPSVLDYLRYSEPFVAFGTSVFRDNGNNFAINYLSGIYQLITDDVHITFDGNSFITEEFTNNLLNISNDSVSVDSSIFIETKEKLKGMIQQYNYRMQHNLMKYQGKLSDNIKE